MRKTSRALSASFVLSLVLLTTVQAAFTHPGLLHTRGDLDRMKRMVQQGAEAISSQRRGRSRPIFEMVWNHYENRKGIPSRYTKQAAEKVRPEGAAFDADHPGFGTLLFTLLAAPAMPAEYAVGADLSFLKQAENGGTVFKDDGHAKPGLQIFREHGYNWIRLRLFHTPARLPNDLDYTIALARDARRTEAIPGADQSHRSRNAPRPGQGRLLVGAGGHRQPAVQGVLR